MFNENINKLEVQKNKRQIEVIIKNSIEEVIRKLLPLKTILKDYLETNLDTETIDNPEIHNSLIDIIKNNIKSDQKETESEHNKSNVDMDEPNSKNNKEEIELHTDKNELEGQSEFQFDENAFLNTISNDIVGDIIDNPNELYDSFEKTNQIKVVNINSEDKLNLNESEKNTTDKDKDKNPLDKNKNYLNNFQTHNTN